MEKLTKQQTAFLNELQSLTEKGVICWKRQEDQLVATISLELNVGFPECDKPVRNVVVHGGGPEIEHYLPVSEDILPDQWVEVEVSRKTRRQLLLQMSPSKSENLKAVPHSVWVPPSFLFEGELRQWTMS
ncbi:MAG TPA: hypothetical protein VNE63_20735 [Candidatus Acidoferrales bacterium]|nr:hypothetical protein [Candidatus Acidoferrales bacterium]